MQDCVDETIESTELQAVVDKPKPTLPERAVQSYEHSTVRDHGRAYFGNTYYNGPVYQSPGPFAHQAHTDPDLEAYNMILGSLRFRGMDDRHATISTAHADTCRWFLNSQEYRSWRDPKDLKKHHGFLWVKGKPGAGKSTLVKSAFDDEMKNSEGSLVVSSTLR